MNKPIQNVLMLFLTGFFLINMMKSPINQSFLKTEAKPISLQDSLLKMVLVNRDITVDEYFAFIDSIVKRYDSITPFKLTEHVLVRANPWIIDTLKNTDYYNMKARGITVFNQKEMVVLNKGKVIMLPDSIFASKLINTFNNTIIDINIPEYKLRIIEDSIEKHTFTIRVGKNTKKYLETAGRIVDLKTKTGNGKIIGFNKNPDYINPVNSHHYLVTKRDDGVVTKLPRIPFIETEINGIRYGQLIHPTTNPITLGKAYSNGCIGTKEKDAWVIYYHAPINTKITIRYNLQIKDSLGNTKALKDIYNYKKQLTD